MFISESICMYLCIYKHTRSLHVSKVELWGIWMISMLLYVSYFYIKQTWLTCMMMIIKIYPIRSFSILLFPEKYLCSYVTLVYNFKPCSFKTKQQLLPTSPSGCYIFPCIFWHERAGRRVGQSEQILISPSSVYR